MNMQTTIPPGTAPADARQHLALTLDLFERDDVEAAVDMLLALLDRADGDLDLEPNGDELDGNASEDDFMLHGLPFSGAGCPVADPREDDDDDVEHDGREPENEDRAAAVYAEAPRYGVDQSLGPVNELDAARSHDRAMYARNADLDRSWRAACDAPRRANA